jgi:Aspartyl/Asparaginyl beta-hydroxylase
MGAKPVSERLSWSSNLFYSVAPDENSLDLETVTGYLMRLRASVARHANGRTLLQHLMGTMSILRAWSQPLYVQVAGLFHSVYSTDAYNETILDITKRENLQKVIGRKAERLVYCFSVMSSADFLEAVLTQPRYGGPMQLRTRAGSGVDELMLEPREIVDLAMITAANRAEQLCDESGAPSAWLSQVSRICHFLRADSGLCPPVFCFCQEVVEAEDESKAIDDYHRALVLMQQDREAADGLFAQCAQLVPWVAEPSLWRSFLASKRADVAAAKDHAGRARRIFAEWGTAWDKRLTYQEWLWVVSRLHEDAGASIVEDVLCRVAAMRIEAATGRGADMVAMPPLPHRLGDYLCTFGKREHELPMTRYPGISMNSSFDPSHFPIVAALEGSFEDIKQEITSLEDDLFAVEGEQVDRTGVWDVLFFYERGKRSIANCARCPTISRILDEYDPVRTMAGGAYVSKLHPHTEIKSHVGPTNMRVRCHLGIQVPDGDCGLRCGGETLRWQNGRCIVFNDCLEHEAWNRTPERRIVLIVDLWHPDLNSQERDILRGLHDFALSYAHNLKTYWAMNDETKTNKRKGYD